MLATDAPTLSPVVDLDAPDAVSLACARTRALDASQPSPALHVDCGRLTCLCHLGVSHVVSQLLRLRRSGARVCLHRVTPLLRRCLQLLHLSPLLEFVDDNRVPLPQP